MIRLIEEKDIVVVRKNQIKQNRRHKFIKNRVTRRNRYDQEGIGLSTMSCTY